MFEILKYVNLDHVGMDLGFIQYTDFGWKTVYNKFNEFNLVQSSLGSASLLIIELIASNNDIFLCAVPIYLSEKNKEFTLKSL